MIGKPGATARGAHGFPIFSVAMLVTLAGQLLAAAVIIALNSAGLVNFSVADPDATAVFYILSAIFILQLIFMLVALARAGLTFGRFIAALAALGWSLGLLMLLWVSLQCWVYGACL